MPVEDHGETRMFGSEPIENLANGGAGQHRPPADDQPVDFAAPRRIDMVPCNGG